ncbi:enhancer of split mbeta protein-like [Portunus trituberculatus]|uniref:Enhancer of split mgamma protein n=1 Tax=Portunus trituberculatus TaxID=210409 RepID=A0A5B7G797_PORTR|nr:enhancer of split mbeta protein-like [Portunus trituberculatus]MPC53133.1 Enhancer of split mgamma protein [Portunus trituberculatus]
MASTYEVNIEDVEPLSRTYQYRKVMKPMLERKRRARINKCLDELKDLMVGALQSEGETITKLEKADVLELTVRHLRKLKQHHALAIPSHSHPHDKFRAGFTHCANEVSRFVTSVPGVDLHVSTRLLSHLGGCITQLDKMTVPQQSIAAPITPAATPSSTPTTTTMVPITVTVPRVYTPPASPETKPSPTTTTSVSVVVSPQPTAVSPKPPTTPQPTPPVSGRVGVPSGSPMWRPW